MRRSSLRSGGLPYLLSRSGKSIVGVDESWSDSSLGAVLARNRGVLQPTNRDPKRSFGRPRDLGNTFPLGIFEAGLVSGLPLEQIQDLDRSNPAFRWRLKGIIWCFRRWQHGVWNWHCQDFLALVLIDPTDINCSTCATSSLLMGVCFVSAL